MYNIFLKYMKELNNKNQTIILKAPWSLIALFLNKMNSIIDLIVTNYVPFSISYTLTYLNRIMVWLMSLLPLSTIWEKNEAIYLCKCGRNLSNKHCCIVKLLFSLSPIQRKKISREWRSECKKERKVCILSIDLV